MKKWIISLLLVLCLIPSALAQEATPNDVVTADTRLGILVNMLPEMAAVSVREGDLKAEGAIKTLGEVTNVQTLSEGLMLLSADRVDALASLYSTALYIAARNDGFATMRARYDLSMCMLAAADQQELIDTLNRGIENMTADGTVTALWDEHVAKVIEGAEPVAVTLPDNPDGRKLRVGVSGDVPPMDYVSADGKPAGFNTALLSELARRENLSVEIVQIDSGARFAALAAGRIDLFFWQSRASGLTNENYAGDIAQYKIAEDESISCLTTIPYISERAGWLIKQAYIDKALSK